jgi:hypothetical protein
MNGRTYINIPEQFDMASDSGYLSRHIELTRELAALGERPGKLKEPDFSQRKAEGNRDEYYEQACENVARAILMDERTITRVERDEAHKMVLDEYNAILKNPGRADSSRAGAVH